MIYWIPLILFVLALFVLFFLMQRRARNKEEVGRAYVDGLKSLLDGEKEKAIEKLKLAVSQDTHNVDAYIRLGDLLRRDGQSNRALHLHLSLMARPGLSQEERGAIARNLAKDYLKLKEPHKAISVLKKWVAKNSKDFRAKESLLSLYEKQNLWKESYTLQQEMLKRKKPFDSSLLALYRSYIGEILLKEGKKREAQDALKQALKHDGTCVPALLYLGDLVYSSNRVEEAIDYWKRIIKDTPFFAPLVFLRLEKAYFAQGRFSELEEIYEDLIERNPEDSRTLFALAKLYLKKGRDGEAQKLYERILELRPNSSQARRGLLEISLNRKNIEEARDHTRALSELMSTENEVYSCSRCGFQSSDYHWRCPKCFEWKTFLPPSLVELQSEK